MAVDKVDALRGRQSRGHSVTRMARGSGAMGYDDGGVIRVASHRAGSSGYPEGKSSTLVLPGQYAE